MVNFFENIFFLFAQLRWQDVLDLLLVWLIAYRVFVIVKATGTLQIVGGLVVLALAYVGSIWLELYTFNWVLEKIFSNLFVIVVVLFQAEIRRALAGIGSRPFWVSGERKRLDLISEVIKACEELKVKGNGAIIILEQEMIIDSVVEFGTYIGALTSCELLVSIFSSTSPLHDGAVLIRDGKIHSAGNFLPLPKNTDVDKKYGTRHRAALGLTLESDAIVVVVSEETKAVSIGHGGELQSYADAASLRKGLLAAMEDV
ncbi:MAG: diadenylate cyclase CdaA [Bdellovibrionota bacterium]